MRIERLNDNQIRCILDKKDLEQRELKLSELAYGSAKAKALFRDMMEKAAAEFGFEVDNIPLMIEAIPVSVDCLILVVTKVEDPEVLDTRFSRFSTSEDEDDGNDEGILDMDMDMDESDVPFDEENEEVLSFGPSEQDGDHAASRNGEETGGTEIGPMDILDTFNKALTAAKKEYLKKRKEAKSAPKSIPDQVYAFDSLDEIIRLSGYLTPFYPGESTLYKDASQGGYYLLLQRAGTDEKLYARACTICADYGECISTSYGTFAYFKEHFTLICEGNALETLQQLR